MTFAYSGKFEVTTGDLTDNEAKTYIRALMTQLIAWAQVARLPQS